MPKTITKIAYPPRLQSKKKVAAYRRWRDIIDCFLTIIRERMKKTMSLSEQ